MLDFTTFSPATDSVMQALRSSSPGGCDCEFYVWFSVFFRELFCSLIVTFGLVGGVLLIAQVFNYFYIRRYAKRDFD